MPGVGLEPEVLQSQLNSLHVSETTESTFCKLHDHVGSDPIRLCPTWLIRIHKSFTYAFVIWPVLHPSMFLSSCIFGRLSLAIMRSCMRYSLISLPSRFKKGHLSNATNSHNEGATIGHQDSILAPLKQGYGRLGS
jgi:hypothetical protein